MKNKSDKEREEAKREKERARKRKYYAKHCLEMAEKKKEYYRKNKMEIKRRRLELATERLELPAYRMATKEEMKSVNSWFALRPIMKANRARSNRVKGKRIKIKGFKHELVKIENGVEYVVFLPLWEIHSANEVSIYLHGRNIHDESGERGTMELPPSKSKDGWIVIDHQVEQYIDDENDRLHVVRGGATILEEVANEKANNNQTYLNGRLNVNFAILVNGLMTKGVGKGDGDRSPDSKRIVFCFTEAGDPFLTFKIVVKKFGKKVAKTFLSEVGRIAEFVCQCMQKMQEKSKRGKPLWTDDEQDEAFAPDLRKKLHLSRDSPMRADMVALCCMKINGEIPRNYLHFDIKNPEKEGYSCSGTFSVVVNDTSGDLHLLQVIVASRRYSKTTGLNGLK